MVELLNHVVLSGHTVSWTSSEAGAELHSMHEIGNIDNHNDYRGTSLSEQ